MAAFQPTSEMHETYKSLVQHDLIDRAKQAHAEAQERTKATAAEVTSAQHALSVAKQVSDGAVAGTGDLSPMDAEEALEIAERRFRVAQKVHQAAEQARDAAHDAIHAADGVAHAPVYRAGMVLRFRACLVADAARKALAAAKTLYDQSSWMLNHAAGAGSGQVFSNEGHDAHREVILPLAEELPYWINSGLRPNWFDGDFEALVKEARK